MEKKVAGIRGAQVKPYFTITRFSGSFSKVRLITAIAMVETCISIALVKMIKIFCTPTLLSVYQVTCYLLSKLTLALSSALFSTWYGLLHRLAEGNADPSGCYTPSVLL